MHIISPYQGTTQISFGMNPAQIESQLGPAISVRNRRFAIKREYLGGVKVNFSLDEQAEEIVFIPPGIVMFDGHNLLEGDDQVEILSKYDDEPMLSFQFVVFLKLGIGIAGFWQHDEDQEAISIFKRGLFDKYLPLMKPYPENSE